MDKFFVVAKLHMIYAKGNINFLKRSKGLL